jgi:hypothetical protein
MTTSFQFLTSVASELFWSRTRISAKLIDTHPPIRIYIYLQVILQSYKLYIYIYIYIYKIYNYNYVYSYTETHTNRCTSYWRYTYMVYFLPHSLRNITRTALWRPLPYPFTVHDHLPTQPAIKRPITCAAETFASVLFIRSYYCNLFDFYVTTAIRHNNLVVSQSLWFLHHNSDLA